MSNHAVLQAINWFSTPAFLVLVLILAYRRLYRTSPFFFAFVFLALLGDVARFIALPAVTRGYLYTYWISHLVNTVFTLLATYELFVRRLFPGFHKITLYRWIFLAASLIIVALGALLVAGSFKVSALVVFLNVLDLFRVALLVFFFALMLLMGRRWEQYQFGIAAGFAVDSAAYFASWAVFQNYALMRRFASEIPAIAYDVACVIWFITFLRPVKQLESMEGISVDTELVELANRSKETVAHWMKSKEPPSS